MKRSSSDFCSSFFFFQAEDGIRDDLVTGVQTCALPILTALRCEYLVAPENIESARPRLSWQIESARRGAAQTAWEILVASSAELLAGNKGDLWKSGRMEGNMTNQVAYAGHALAARTECFWKVRIWDEQGKPSAWSPSARWSMGLLRPDDWRAEWISYRDNEPLHADPASLHLPAARHYRKDFTTAKSIRRATVYASALGLYELYCNGQRVGDAYFKPGWSDYLQRAYYRSHDVTALLRSGGANTLGAVVADGGDARYVGFGLLAGYGPNNVGRYFYGKTPALLAQLEIDYTDGMHAVVVTDGSWRVTDRGPNREAAILMGESYYTPPHPGACAAPGSPPKQ